MIGNNIEETKYQTIISLSGNSTNDCSAIAGVLPPPYLIVKSVLSKEIREYVNGYYYLYVYLIVSKLHLQTHHVLMFTFTANYY